MDRAEAEEAAIRARALTFLAILAALLFARALLLGVAQTSPLPPPSHIGLPIKTFADFISSPQPIEFDGIDLNCSEPPSLSTVMNTAAAERRVHASQLDD